MAGQTAKASAEIARQVSQIQSSTEVAASTIDAIASTIGEVEFITRLVVNSVEAQSQATHEISLSARRAATGTGTLTGSVDGVMDVVAKTSETAASVDARSQELAIQARTLSSEVTKFIRALRSGPLDRRKPSATDIGVERRAC